MLADVFHWRQIRSVARREIISRKANNASALLSGKEVDDSNYPAHSGERSERTAAQGSWSIGRCRRGLLEGVCDEVVTAQRPGDVADTVGAQRVRCRGGV